MNYLFKAAAGVMSALILAAGAGFTTSINRDCTQSLPNSCTHPTMCASESDCTGIDTEKLQKLLHECENKTEMLNVLLENNLCSKDDLNCIIDSGSCTVDDICNVLEGCDTDCCDIVSVIEYACTEQETNCNENTSTASESIACETDTQKAVSTDEHTVTDISTDSNAISEQTSENNQNCAEKDCIIICDINSDCKNVICEDNDCSSETSSDTDCSEFDCLSEDANDSSIDSESLQRNTYSNINDILKSFELETTTNTTCNSDSGCNENTSQQDKTQPRTDTETGSSNETATFDIADYEEEVVRLVNEIRVSYGLSELTLNKDLSAVARLKSEDMRDKHYFSHNSPTFGSPFEMMNHFGIHYRTAGENIAMGQKTPKEVVNGWMNSDGHRANILNNSFTEIGVGYAENGHYWTQMFIG